MLKVYILVTIYHIYQLAVLIFSKGRFYFQGESDDCINRLAKKDGLLAKYVSQCGSLVTSFRLLWSFVFNVEVAVGALRCVYVSRATTVSEGHAASIFMVKVGTV